MSTNRTGRALAVLREQSGRSWRDLAAALHCDHSSLANIAAGRRWPQDRNWAEQVDRELAAEGRLLAAWDADQRERAETANTMRLLKETRRESEQLLTLPDAADLDALNQRIADLATSARFEPPSATLTGAMNARRELLRRLRSGAYHPDQQPELYLALGRACGILAYITLDLGQHETAEVHGAATFALADRANNNELRAWARGTQSLTFRFAKKFEQAAAAAADGLQYTGPSTGIARARLLCGLGQSTSNLGDTGRAMELLDEAAREREVSRELPDQRGLFGFTETKQIYYSGSAMMWATDPAALRKSVADSTAAIAHWKQQRSPGDEMLSQVYLGIANVKLGELDAGLAAIRPVLDRPISDHFSWVRKRLRQLDEILGQQYPDTPLAAQARDELHAYTRS